MAKIKLVVFDMDGTLLKPRSCWAYIHEHFGTDNSEMLKLYIEQKITDIVFYNPMSYCLSSKIRIFVLYFENQEIYLKIVQI